MTKTRKPTDGTTPAMVLGALAETAVFAVWDATTKVGHRMTLSTLRAWLIARLMPTGTAGRVVVTDGMGGIADGGVTLDALGGGGGGPQTVRILNLDDAVPEEHDGILVHTLLAADVNNAVIVPFSADEQALALPGVDAEVGDELDVIYGDPALLVVGDPPYDEPGYLQLGVEPREEGGHYSVALLAEGPAELSYGQAARLLKTNEVSQGPYTFHLWKVLAISDSGGSGGEYAALYHAYSHGQYGNDPITPSSIGAIARPYPPPAYGRKALWDGSGGLIDGGDDGPTQSEVPTVLTLASSPTAHIECATAGQMRGGVGMTVQVTLRLTKPPTAAEVCAGNFTVGATTGGWGIGLDATGFKIWVARNSDGVLQTNTPEGVAAFASYGIGSMLGRLYVLRLRVSGTTASLYVNGVLSQSVTIAGGLRPADAAGKMMVHRNNSDITPMRADALNFHCLYYHEAEPAALFYGFEYHHFVETQKLNGTIPLLQSEAPTAARYVLEIGPSYPTYAYNSGNDASDALVFGGIGDVSRGLGVVQW